MQEARKISKKYNPIRQHHAPQVYLRNFCNESKAIAVMDKINQRIFSTGIRAVGAENDFYTLEKMDDPYCWEHIYANGIEPQMGELIPKIISQGNLLARDGAIIINDSEKVQLAAIMVMQLLRGKQSRDYERKLYQSYLPETLKKTKEVFAPLSEKQKELLHAYENDDYYFKQTSMDLALDSKRITQYTEIICNHDFFFYRIQGGLEFITSDNPVMLVNSITGNSRPFANGLLKVSTAVYYPLSPKLLLCVLHPEFSPGVFWGKNCCIVDLDSNREIRFISRINRKQIEQCSQHAFARSEDVLKRCATQEQTPARVK